MKIVTKVPLPTYTSTYNDANIDNSNVHINTYTNAHTTHTPTTTTYTLTPPHRHYTDILNPHIEDKLMEFTYVELLLPMMAMSARIFLVGQPEAFIDWFYQQSRAIRTRSIHWYAFHGLIHTAT